MPDKKYLNKFDKTRFLLKNIGILRFVPLIVLDVIIPLLIFMNVLDGENTEKNLLTIVHYILPLNSVWFSLFTMKEFIEAEGKEIYYMLGKVNILAEAFKFYLILFLNVLFLLIIICVIIPEFSVEIFRISAACLFYFSIVYFVSMVSKSTSIALFFVVLYTLINVIFRTHEVQFLIYSTINLPDRAQLIEICIPLLIISFIMIVIGKAFEKRINIFD